MLTKKHYIAIGKVIRDFKSNYKYEANDWNALETADLLSDKLADYFAKDNPNFDRARFLEAAGNRIF